MRAVRVVKGLQGGEKGEVGGTEILISDTDWRARFRFKIHENSVSYAIFFTEKTFLKMVKLKHYPYDNDIAVQIIFFCSSKSVFIVLL